jgi:hypothetical protein
MAKYSKKIAKKICDLYERGNYTIAQVCLNVGISESCFYKWQVNSEEFTEKVKEARDKYISKKLVECDQSLEKLINGYDFDEKKTITVDTGKKDDSGKPIIKIKEQTIIKKHIAPSLGAIIHFQTNRDPQNWKNRQSSELTGKDGKDLIPENGLAGLSTDELKQLHTLLAKAGAKK